MSGKNVSMNENQMELLYKCLEDLHSITDWEELTNSIVIEGQILIGAKRGLLLLYDISLKDLIPQGSTIVENNVKWNLIGIAKKYLEERDSKQKYFQEGHYYFFVLPEQYDRTGFLIFEMDEDIKLSEVQTHLMSIYLQSVSVILEKSRLFLTMQRKSESHTFMRRLQRVMKDYTSQEILTEIVNKIGEFLNSEMAGIMFYDPDHNELRLQKPAFGLWDDSIIAQYRISMDQHSNAKQVFLTGVPSITADAENDERYYQPIVRLFKAKTIITVPITVNNNPIGVIHAINKKNGYFLEDDLIFLTEIATELGSILLDRLERIPEKEKKKRKELERYLKKQMFEYLLFNVDENEKEARNIIQTLQLQLHPKMTIFAAKFYSGNRWIDKDINDNGIEWIEKQIPSLHGCANDGIYYFLYSYKEDDKIHEVVNVLHNHLRKLVNNKCNVYIGVGESVTSIRDLSRSAWQASQILSILPNNEHLGEISYYSNSSSWTLLSNLVAWNEQLVREYVNLYLEKINRLKDGEEMKKTLSVYLKHNGHMKNAAEELYIHQNTLKYRIEKIMEVTDLQLQDSENRLNLQLALRLEKLLERE